MSCYNCMVYNYFFSSKLIYSTYNLTCTTIVHLINFIPITRCYGRISQREPRPNREDPRGQQLFESAQPCGEEAK